LHIPPRRKGGDGGDASPKKEPAFAPPEIPDNLVTLHFKLRDWNFLDFSLKLRSDTPLFKIKDELVSRHGNLEELSMFKNAMSEENEMRDEMKTLEQYGIMGAPNGEGDGSEVQIFYDFVPEKVDDPLLSC